VGTQVTVRVAPVTRGNPFKSRSCLRERHVRLDQDGPSNKSQIPADRFFSLPPRKNAESSHRGLTPGAMFKDLNWPRDVCEETLQP
jgi:hypothetical protein